MAAARWRDQPVTHQQRPATSNTAGEQGPTRAPTNGRRTPRTPPQSPPRTPPPLLPPPPPQEPGTRHKAPASMGSSAEAVPTSSAEVVSHFFDFGEKREKNP